MLNALVTGFKMLKSNKKGQGMVEYALIIGLVAVVLIGVLMALSGQIETMFDSIVTALTPES